MNSIETLTTFFGWCTVINFGLLLFVLLMWTGLRDFMSKLFMKIFDVTQEESKATFFRIFMQYRLAIVVLNLVPWIVVTIMGSG